jgi:hypothetical protein
MTKWLNTLIALKNLLQLIAVGLKLWTIARQFSPLKFTLNNYAARQRTGPRWTAFKLMIAQCRNLRRFALFWREQSAGAGL